MTISVMGEDVALDDGILDDAIAWMILIEDEDTGDDCRDSLRDWLNADCRHRQAWDRLQHSLDPFKIVRSTTGLGSQLIEAIEKKRSRRDFVRIIPLFAAGAGGLSAIDRVYPLDGLLADVSTPTGERKSLVLSDGSLLQLDARSRADFVGGGDRQGIIVREGKALVTVRRASSPFVLRAGDLTLRLVEGSAMATCHRDTASVICVNGRAAFTRKGRPAEMLRADEGFAVRDGALDRMTREETLGAAAWTAGQLVLQNRTLAAMIEAYRPYRPGLIFLSGAAAAQRVSGVFDLEQMDTALDMVRKILPIRVMTLGQIVTRIDFEPRHI